jgi:hypothetical protein
MGIYQILAGLTSLSLYSVYRFFCNALSSFAF